MCNTRSMHSNISSFHVKRDALAFVIEWPDTIQTTVELVSQCPISCKTLCLCKQTKFTKIPRISIALKKTCTKQTHPSRPAPCRSISLMRIRMKMRSRIMLKYSSFLPMILFQSLSYSFNTQILGQNISIDQNRKLGIGTMRRRLCPVEFGFWVCRHLGRR